MVFLIEGSNFDESGEVRTGNANYRPNGRTHTVSTKHGGTAIAFVTGGVEMIKYGNGSDTRAQRESP